jgi:radical SAM family uncharacterized protein
MSWPLKEKLQKKLAAERGAAVFAPGARTGFALAYPNTYHVGMSNLGFQIIYREINSRGDTACERVFLPDRKDESEYLRTHTPLLTLETQRPLAEFPLIGIDITFEMDYFNILKMLDFGRVPLEAADRGEGDPIVIAGGPCATFNPEPLAAFIDAFVIGEGETVIHEILDVYHRGHQGGLSRADVIAGLANLEGVYVPGRYTPDYNADGTLAALVPHGGAPAAVRRRWQKDLDACPGQTAVSTDDTEFGDMFLIEVARGCGRHCRFCMAGYCYRRPRVRSLASLEKSLHQAAAVSRRVGLVGAAISDHPDIDALVARILEAGLTFSVASLRADSVTPALMAGLAASGHKTVTLAPEAASERLRAVINKGITDAHLADAVTLAVLAGIPNVRLYIMVGLPGEDDSDIAAIADLARRVKSLMRQLGSGGKLTLSINPFIPKPFTPFQWLPMTASRVVEARLKAIRTALKADKNIETLIEPPREAYIQGSLARGDRRLGSALLAAHRLGGAKAWSQALKQVGLDEDFYLYRQRRQDEILPWQHLDVGVKPAYLQQELDRALAGAATPPCRPDCRRCGVCG